MKIVFICGCLEPGYDGVGDYTRKLSIELKKRGNEAAIIALSDKFVFHTSESIQFEESVEIRVLRIPMHLQKKEVFQDIHKFIMSVDPDWLSLQYVPYSFHSKGLPFTLIKYLREIGKGRRWNIMFHETWVGIKKNSPFTHHFYGFLQKKLARLLVNALKPALLFTSNRLYEMELTRIGICSKILPLFSNISVFELDKPFIAEFYRKLDISEDQRKFYCFIGIFGGINEEINLEKIIHDEVRKSGDKNKKIVFVAFGRTGNKEIIGRLKLLFEGRVLFAFLGELPENQISSILQILDLGISLTPEEYISKSGVYAAMKLHKLHVILFSSIVIPRYKEEIKRFNEYLESRESYKWSVKYITEEFYEHLSLHTNF